MIFKINYFAIKEENGSLNLVRLLSNEKYEQRYDIINIVNKFGRKYGLLNDLAKIIKKYIDVLETNDTYVNYSSVSSKIDTFDYSIGNDVYFNMSSILVSQSTFIDSVYGVPANSLIFKALKLSKNMKLTEKQQMDIRKTIKSCRKKYKK